MKNSSNSKKKSKPARPNSDSEPLSPEDTETLEELLARLGIKDWDVVLVGDGSGSGWTREAAWACVSVERLTMERMVHGGMVNRGTVNFAEMMAYLQPLEWLASREAERRKKTRKTRAYNVHIVTDSDYCRQTGNKADRSMTKNAGMWSAFDAFARHGFVLHWHWVRRESCGLNRYCDKLSKLYRKFIKGSNLVDTVQEAEGRTVYEINPSEAG